MRAAILFACLSISALVSACEETVQLRVLTDRTASHLETLFREYEKAFGVEVVTNYVGDGLLARLQNRPKEADIAITKNAYLLEIAKRQNLLSPFRSGSIERNVPSEFRDPERYYTVLSYRARLVYYSADRVTPGELSSYLQLADRKWKRRICIRSGFHDYNLSLLSQMAAVYGVRRVEAFLRGLRANLARPPRGNDRAQVRGIFEGKCDVAIANSYYMGIMLSREDQRAWARSSRVYFPDQRERGTFVIRSGAGLTTAQRNRTEATKLLEFLTGDYAQTFFAQSLFAYPVKEGVPIAALNRTLGAEQGIREGAFKRNVVPLSAMVGYRDQMIEILTRLDFDRPM